MAKTSRKSDIKQKIDSVASSPENKQPVTDDKPFNEIEQAYILSNIKNKQLSVIAEELKTTKDKIKAFIRSLRRGKGLSQRLFGRHKSGGVVIASQEASQRADEYNKRINKNDYYNLSDYIFRPK
jgi:hypothetical protein